MAQAETTATEPVWKGVAWLAFLGTVGSLALSVGLNYLLLFSDVLTPFGRSMVTAVLLPLIIGLPLFVLIGLKQAQIRGYRRELNRAETYDRVTGCLNGPVFTSMVERRAARPSAPGPRSGAFLVIHAEHLRSINLRFGPDWGDEALRLVASAIQSSVRKEDMVGRIGTSMFESFFQVRPKRRPRKLASAFGQASRGSISRPRGPRTFWRSAWEAPCLKPSLDSRTCFAQRKRNYPPAHPPKRALQVSSRPL
ncbi:GGDEF domain-containing protein [Mesorhizobium sp. ORM16]|uniref:GGDEF domain-containing protein n=1 Tax=Mesorhizobium sp. ORM16 TaxID=3376989 RepID=UPI003857C3A2